MKRFADWLIQRVLRRSPDFIIGGAERPYLRRWWLIPRNPVFNIYVHQFLRSDDDRALHDHPWANLSILLRGAYIEHTIAAGGIEQRRILHSGQWRLRLSGRFAHRVELLQSHWPSRVVEDGFTRLVDVAKPIPCWTLFITGPRYRSWGFHCSDGWVHWREFTAPGDEGGIGKGCGQ